jgi:hypothetical protein
MKYEYKFKIYTYINGEGYTLYRVKMKGFWGIYWWIYFSDLHEWLQPSIYDNKPATWYKHLTGREGCIRDITRMCKRFYNAEKAVACLKKKDTLKLVFVEQEPVKFE